MTHLHQIPLFQDLDSAQRILIAGAGGGFDIYSGLPLYLSLKAQGKEVFLANFAFTWLEESSATQIFPNLYKVEASSVDNSGRNYFPEKYLAEWLSTQGIEAVVYSFLRTGVQPLKNAYNFLIEHLQLDCIVLVDGGTDSLMFGNEESLGTPAEDSCSLAAVYQSNVHKKLLVCLGFGVDHFHGVSHYRFLENLALLIRNGGFIGSFHLTIEMEEGKQLQAAVDFVNKKMPQQLSIVSNSIVSALEGHYGNFHRTPRTTGSELWINPLMSIYWCFSVEKVIEQLRYYDLIKNTLSLGQLNGELSHWHRTLKGKRAYKQLPI